MLWRQYFIVLNRHTLTQVTFHTSQTDTYLVSKQFTNGTNTTVTQVVNIIYTTNTLSQVEEVAHFSQDVRRCYCTYFFCWISITNHRHNTFWILRSYNLEFLQKNWLKKNSVVIWNILYQVELIELCFYFFKHITTQYSTSFQDNFACLTVNHMLSKCLVEQTSTEVEFFINLVTTNRCQVVTTWVKETSCQKTTRAFSCLWFTWTKALIDFLKRFICTRICWVFMNIFFNGIANQFAITKDIKDFIIT